MPLVSRHGEYLHLQTPQLQYLYCLSYCFGVKSLLSFLLVFKALQCWLDCLVPLCKHYPIKLEALLDLATVFLTFFYFYFYLPNWMVASNEETFVCQDRNFPWGV